MPITEGIIAGLIANSLTELIRYLDPGSAIHPKTQRPVVEALREDKVLEAALRKAVVAVAKEARFDDQNSTDKLQMFLISPDAEAIVRQMYGLWLIPEKRSKAEPELRKEFTLLMAIHLGVEANDVNEIAGEIFQALITGSDVALKVMVAKGLLLAHEAKSERRFRLLSDELSTIERNLELLRQPLKLNLGEIYRFEEKYRLQLIDRHGHITPPHFDVSRKIPVKDICVPARLYQDPPKRDEKPVMLDYETFLSGFYRAVILGNPGGGKSTLASKLCFDVASEYKKRHLAGRQVTPILVILRDYGAAKKQKPLSIVQFMEMVANSNYQIPPPHHSFEYMLLNGRAVVIFDGLDELLDTSYRQEISGDIDSFCTLYPSVPTLVTSREVGYEQAPLDKKKFRVFKLAPFDEEQIQQYVQKWFAADPDLLTTQQRQKVKAFLDESKIVSDLRSNPLMLALMCNIYRGENYIPRNRPDVYEKCALMLFEKWDKSRGIFVPLPFEAHISPAMKFLAFWIYSEERLQGGVSEQRLMSKAADYLSPRRYEDRAEAEQAAGNFIDFCTGRAWVFTDTGTTKEGEKLYQFTHRTFLEYFTAAHLIRTHPTPRGLSDALLGKIARREWDVVAQLAYQLQNKQVEGAGDELLNEIVKRAETSAAADGWNLLSFAARCLEFIVPSPKTVREITAACADRVLKRADKGSKGIKGTPTEILTDLLLATDENVGPLSDSLEKILISRIDSTTETTARDALALTGRLTWSLSDRSEVREEIFMRWQSFSRRLIADKVARLRDIAGRNLEVGLMGYSLDVVNLTEIMSWHGSRGLFMDSGHWLFPNMFTACLAYQLLSPTLLGLRGEGSKYSANTLIAALSETGQFLLKAAVPWWSSHVRPPFFFHEGMFDRKSTDPKLEKVTLHEDSLFGAFALFVGILDGVDNKKELEPVCKYIRKSKLPFYEHLSEVILSRFDQPDEAKAKEQLLHSGFSGAQLSFVKRWTSGELALGELTE